MAVISSKWLWPVLLIVLVMVVLLLLGRKSVETEIEIKASSQEVWSVLTDVPGVKEWNKVLIPIKGELQVGNTIKYEFYQEENGKAAVMDATVKELVPSQLINQRGGIPGVLTFDHRYLISQAGEITTVRIHEKYRGLMVPFWNPQPVEAAYQRLLVSLKKRVISLQANPNKTS